MTRKTPKFISSLLCFLLIFEQSSFAQVASQLDISGHLAALRSAFTPDVFRPLHLRYLSYNPIENNFQLFLDKGSLKNPSQAELQDTTKTLLNYFFIGISLPNDTFWVNLRPDAEDNIIDDRLAQTDIGRIMLETDLQLKKDTAAFTSPETPEGREYWDKLYKKAGEIFGSQNITIPTLTRPWIVPDEIIIRETQDSAYIYKATLKVMLESDYLRQGLSPSFDSAQDRQGTVPYSFQDERLKELNEYSSQLIRELIIPKLTKEVNSSKRYASLRQVYYSLIMAQWFKARHKSTGTVPLSSLRSAEGNSSSLRGREAPEAISSRINSNDLTNLTSKDSWSKTTYFQAYQKSFKDGEYNIKEPVYTPYGQTIRSYFSGGMALQNTTPTGIVPAGTSTPKLIGKMRYLLPALVFGGLTVNVANAGEMRIEIKEETALTASQPQERKKSEILSPEAGDILLKSISGYFSAPKELWADTKQKPPLINGLDGYSLVSDAGTGMDAVILQAGDGISLIMADKIIGALKDDVKVVVLVNSQVIAYNLWNKFKDKDIPHLSERLRFVFVNSGFSSWGRDPYVVLFNPSTKEYTLFPSRGDAGTRLDRKMGTELMNQGIGLELLNQNNFADNTLDLQGGDVTSDDKYVYVGNQTVHYSRYDGASRLLLTEEEAIDKIGRITGKEVIVLHGPDIHNDRYHLPVGRTKFGEHTSLVADPLKALEITASMTPEEKETAISRMAEVLSSTVPTKHITVNDIRTFFDKSPEMLKTLTNSKFVKEIERVKKELEEHGIKVISIPTLPMDLAANPIGFYYVNSLMDRGRAIVPSYLIPRLDAEAQKIFKGLGFEVVPVESIIPGALKGGLRCLVQVLGRPVESNLEENKQLAENIIQLLRIDAQKGLRSLVELWHQYAKQNNTQLNVIWPDLIQRINQELERNLFLQQQLVSLITINDTKNNDLWVFLRHSLQLPQSLLDALAVRLKGADQKVRGQILTVILMSKIHNAETLLLVNNSLAEVAIEVLDAVQNKLHILDENQLAKLKNIIHNNINYLYNSQSKADSGFTIGVDLNNIPETLAHEIGHNILFLYNYYPKFSESSEYGIIHELFAGLVTIVYRGYPTAGTGYGPDAEHIWASHQLGAIQNASKSINYIALTKRVIGEIVQGGSFENIVVAMFRESGYKGKLRPQRMKIKERAATIFVPDSPETLDSPKALDSSSSLQVEKPSASSPAQEKFTSSAVEGKIEPDPNQLKQYITDHRQNPFEVLINAIRENQVVTLGEYHGVVRMIKFAADALPLLVRQGLTHLAFEGDVQDQNALEVFILAWKDSGEDDFDKFIEKEIWVKIVDAGGRKYLEFSPLLKRLPKSRFLEEADILYGRKSIPPLIELLSDIIPSVWSRSEYIRERFRFFKAAYDEGIKVEFIDTRTAYGQEGDKEMAEAIASMIADNPSAKILFYGGDAHARKNEYVANKFAEPNELILTKPISQYLRQLLPDIRVYTIVQGAPRNSFLWILGLEELGKESFALVNLEDALLMNLPFTRYAEDYHWFEVLPSNRLGSLADAVILHGLNPANFPPKATSSPMRQEQARMGDIDGSTPLTINSQGSRNTGGIDFRSLPIVTQAMSNLSAVLRDSPLRGQSLLKVNLNEEWEQIERMASAGITPSSERIKEYIQTSCAQDSITQDKDKILLCISDILRLQEESCDPTDDMLRDILVVLESMNSAREFKEIFLGASPA